MEVCNISFSSYLSYNTFFFQAVDWWSLGVLTYELLTGASPFTVDGESNSQSEISRYQSRFVFRIFRTQTHAYMHTCMHTCRQA